MMPYYKTLPTETFADRLYRGFCKFAYRLDFETPEQARQRRESVRRHQPNRWQRIREAIVEYYV